MEPWTIDLLSQDGYRNSRKPEASIEQGCFMWPDNETERDFLNFTGVADTVAEIIVQANGCPISIGVSGAGVSESLP